MADQMPFQLRDFSKVRYFTLRLLNAIFTESTKPGLCSLNDGFLREGLTDGQKRNLVRQAPALHGGIGNPFPDGLNVFMDLIHERIRA